MSLRGLYRRRSENALIREFPVGCSRLCVQEIGDLLNFVEASGRIGNCRGDLEMFDGLHAAGSNPGWAWIANGAEMKGARFIYDWKTRVASTHIASSPLIPRINLVAFSIRWSG